MRGWVLDPMVRGAGRNQADGQGKPDGGSSTVDIIRDTVPATGLDVATQTVILDHDEADQVASVLQSRSVADRLAFLERRVAELTEEAS